MKRITLLACAVILILLLTACSGELTDRNRIIRVYRKNEAAFIKAASEGKFKDLEQIDGVQEVSVRRSGDYYEVDIYCGGSGFGSSTSYYGILYSEDFYPESNFIEYPNEWFIEGNGFRYKQADGDNSKYYESLGNNYYYYEEHY